MCNNGDFENLREGDYKTIELTTGEIVQPQIAGLDTYRDSSYSSTVSIFHHIDWISKDCLSDTVQWNTSNTNQGTEEEPSPYLSSNVYNILMNTIYPTIPSDIQAVIYNKELIVESKYSSSSTLTSATSLGWKNLGPIWLPNEIEMYGRIQFGTQMYGSATGSLYALFLNSVYHRVKRKGYNGDFCSYWLISTAENTTTRVCMANGGGYGSLANASQNFNVPICFRIGLEYNTPKFS